MPRARTEQAKDQRRADVLAAALDEFFERGYAAARMHDIADRAGLSKGTLYLYFASKEELFRALIDTFAMPNLEMIETLANAAPSFHEAIDKLATAAPIMIRETRLPKLMKVIIGDSHNFPELVVSYRDNVLNRLIGIIAELLKRSAAAGEIRVEEPALTARLVMAPIAFSGLWHAVFAQTPGGVVDIERIFRLHAENMKRALAVTRA